MAPTSDKQEKHLAYIIKQQKNALKGKVLKQCPGCKCMVKTRKYQEHVLKCSKVEGHMLSDRERSIRLKTLLAPQYDSGDFKAPTENPAGAYGLSRNRKH